jgi:hypothetical protein
MATLSAAVDGDRSNKAAHEKVRSAANTPPLSPSSTL